jgi:hypothetical protein
MLMATSCFADVEIKIPILATAQANRKRKIPSRDR